MPGKLTDHAKYLKVMAELEPQMNVRREAVEKRLKDMADALRREKDAESKKIADLLAQSSAALETFTSSFEEAQDRLSESADL